MVGRHSAQTEEERDRGPLRRSFPVLAGTAVAVLLIGGAVAAVRLGSPADGTPHGLAISAPVTGTDPADLDRSADRADRSENRQTPTPEPSPSSTAAATPSQTPSTKRASPTAAATTGTVTSTGSCKASYYATGSTTANGEAFEPDGITAAHKTLPFNTRVRVTNLANNTSVVVRINDRGPYVDGRCIDLSRGAFKAVASLNAGVITVRYEVLG